MQTDSASALLSASQEGHCGVVKVLLEAKADVNIKKNVSVIFPGRCSDDLYS